MNRLAFAVTDTGTLAAHALQGLAIPLAVLAVTGAASIRLPIVSPQGAWAAPGPSPRRVSGAWWLLPIFMGWLGGLIAWLVNKDADPKRARAMLITGIAVSAVLIILLMSAPSSTS